jgi:AMMECR1 domain-containing protein/orotate phosphoribosyltransferase
MDFATLSPGQLAEALLSALRQDGVLWEKPDQPVVDRYGSTAPWMFYSWNLSMTAGGSELAGRCILQRLTSFESTQLATYGTTAIPLLSSCILLGKGKYTGVCVRENPKGGKEGRQVEGPAKKAESIVLIDDSLSAGTSLLNGIAVLEQKGFQVEGAVALVHFPHRGGRERAEALGYRVEVLFDIWQDLKMPRPVHVPGFLRVGQFARTKDTIEEGLPPTQVARLVAESLLAYAAIPEPPHSFDTFYEGRGGVWVSFRDRRTNVRLARDGFWHFNPDDADVYRDVVLATAKTVQSGGLHLAQLKELKIAVTFFGPLQLIKPKGLDFSRYGVVVRSSVWPVKVGGALPNTQVFTSECEQLDLAKRNASLGAFEPYELYRHTVAKQVEPGEAWLPYGVADEPIMAWTNDPTIGEKLVSRAHAAAGAFLTGKASGTMPLEPRLIPVPIGAVGVTLLKNGVLGCAVSERRGLDEAVVAAAEAAVQDARFATITAESFNNVQASVSVLYDPEQIPWTTAKSAVVKLRLGRDSLAVKNGDKQAIFLESVAPHYDWEKEKIAERILKKACIADQSGQWTTFRTTTWLGTGASVVRQSFGFADLPAGRCDAKSLYGDLALVGGYIDANLLESGLPLYARTPVPGWVWEEGSAARLIHGLGGLLQAGRLLGRADWMSRAERGIRLCLEAVQVPAGRLLLDKQRCGPMADCDLLAVSCDAGLASADWPQIDALFERVSAMFRPNGWIHPDGQPVRSERDADYLPNAAILAIAAYKAANPTGLAAKLEPYRAWQERRFRLLHRWGQAGWLPQACAEVFRATGGCEYSSTAFLVADWCLEQQIDATGAFLTDLSPGGPTFHTAFIAEGIADTWATAMACQDYERALAYERAWWRAMEFVRRLIIRPADAICFADPDRSIGGVRGSLTSSTIRIDFVSHVAIALAKGLRLVESTRHIGGESSVLGSGSVV